MPRLMAMELKSKSCWFWRNKRYTPFLMIDEQNRMKYEDYVGGFFLPHPHRGIETLTYMLQGHFQHKDHMGNIWRAS